MIHADEHDVGRRVIYNPGFKGARLEAGEVVRVGKYILVRFEPTGESAGIDIPAKSCRPEDLTWLGDLL